MRRVLIAVAMMVTTITPLSAASADTAQSTFIVVLRPGITDVDGTAEALADAVGGDIGSVYDNALEGFSIVASNGEAAALATNSAVAYVERDRLVTIDAQTVPTGIRRSFASTNPSIDIDESDDIRVDVDVAVMDTGVDFEQPDLVVAGGVNCTSGTGCVAGGDDNEYHGTHVAGTIVALDNGIGVVGIAPGARIWSVKVLDSTGNGQLSWIVDGLEWIAANSATIEIGNMSFGAVGPSQALYDATQGAVANGVAFAVSAGNSDTNAIGFSPAAFDNVLTVSALADFDGIAGAAGSPTCAGDQDDTLADFSNWGAVDIAAPGLCIASTVPLEWGSYGLLSGTSMASPHVAGALALLARADNPDNAADVFALYSQVLAAGNTNWTDDSGDGVKEPLLDLSNSSLFAAAPPPPCASIDMTSMIGWWRGESDLSAQVGPAASGVSAFGTGKVGQALSLNATSSVSVSGLLAPASAVTVEAWIRPTATGTMQTVMSRWSAPSTDDSAREFALLVDPKGDLIWTTDETTARRPEELRAGAPQIFDAGFHHVAATWNSTVSRVYVDGVMIGSKPSQGGTLNPTPSTQFRVGSKTGLGDPFALVGALDEPSVWGRSLSDAEIAAIHAAGASGKCRA